jgi:pyruvate/2-oxoglutarate dehydrogenase complex dihydrolipoamide acyltransferase (E2) component
LHRREPLSRIVVFVNVRNEKQMSVVTEIRIPHMGSVENAKLVAWHVQEGDSINAGDLIYEVETDKTVTEVQADTSGVLVRRVAEAEAELKVGDLVGYLASASASASEIEQSLRLLSATVDRAEAQRVLAGSTAGIQSGGSDRSQQISPLVRRLAKEHGVDLATVSGTGPNGKITGDDVLRAAGTGAVAKATSDVPLIPGHEGVPFEAIPNSTRRKAIARRLLESVRTAPQLTADVEVDLSTLLAAREAINARRQVQGTAPVSVLSLIAATVCELLQAHPWFNATFTESHSLHWKVVNLGIAVDAPDGLVVPVIRDAGRRSVEEIDAAIRDFAARARNGELRSEELDGGTFTISNPGALGPVLRAEGILNPPQVALLGLPAIHRAPLAVKGDDEEYRLEIRPIIKPSLTFDHRALDGGHVVRFLGDLKERLERLKQS